MTKDFLAEICLSSTRSHALKTQVKTVMWIQTLKNILNLPEVIAFLENVYQFFELKGYTFEATETMSLISSLTKLHSVNL